MNTKTLAPIILIAILLGSFNVAKAEPDTKSSDAKPNIVLIFADDLGYGDTSCYGATKIKTPCIDKLATEGRRFTDAHSASAVCTPSRYALLTGEYPLRINSFVPVFMKSGLLIKPSKTTVASLLKSQGYATACVGKWHLGLGEKTPNWNGELKPGPLEVGFDYFFGLPIVNCAPPYVYVENHRVVGWDPNDPLVFGKNNIKEPAATKPYEEKFGLDQVGGARAAHELYREEEFATTLTDKAKTWMREHKDEPFFLYFSTPHIHHPFTPGPKFKGSSECGLYGDFVQEFDWMVGEILQTLDDLNLSDNTLVIVTSDNGGMINKSGQRAVKAGHRLNGDLLGFKFDAWEGGHREPFIARWPGKIPAGTVSSETICHVDMLATVAALTGAGLADKDALDSFNMLPALLGTPDQPIHDHLVIAACHKSHLAIRQGRWVYIGAQGGGGFSATRVGEHGLGGPPALKFAGEVNSDIEDGHIKPDAPKAQLYDLVADPSQKQNVIRENPEVAKRMAALLKKCISDGRTRPTTNQAESPSK